MSPWRLALTALFAVACTPDAAPAPAPTSSDRADSMHDGPAAGPGGRTVYVPAYSHLSTGGDDRRMLLAITLSVRNVDPSATVTLTQVEYFDTSGHRLRRYLRRPQTLRPLETAEFSVGTFDERGGSGANFLVFWEGPDGAHPLLTEAIMFGHVGTGYMSFTSRGVELERPPQLDAMEDEAETGAAGSGAAEGEPDPSE